MKRKQVLLGLVLAVALVITPVGNLFSAQVSASGNNTETGSGNNTETGSGNNTENESGGNTENGSGGNTENGSGGNTENGSGDNTENGSGNTVTAAPEIGSADGESLGSFTTANGTTVTSSVAGSNSSAEIKYAAVTTPKSSFNAAAGLSAERLKAGESIYITIAKSQCGEKARQAVTNAASSVNAKIAAILEIDLNLLNKEGIPQGKVTELTAPVEMMISSPEGYDGKSYDFAVIRIHDGKTDILPDMDSNPDTITFMTDKFSVYAVSYGPKGSFDAFKSANTKGVKDNVPKTGVTDAAALPFVLTGIVLAGAAVAMSKKKEA